MQCRALWQLRATLEDDSEPEEAGGGAKMEAQHSPREDSTAGWLRSSLFRFNNIYIIYGLTNLYIIYTF